MPRAPLAIVAWFALASSGRAADDAKKALEKLQGNWTVESIEEDGKSVPADDAKKYTMTIKDDTFAVTGPEGKSTGTIKLDPAKMPPHIDLVASDQKNRPSLFGIYELRDGTLKIAGNEDGKKRPAEFNSAKGCNMIVLKRK